MKVERKEGTEEKRILTAMITDLVVLGKLANGFKDPFRSAWANLVGSWCVSFYNKYGKAPGRHIEHLFEEWASTNEGEDSVKFIRRFLAGLSAEYKELSRGSNSQYILDLSANYLTGVRVQRLKDQIENALESGAVDKAATMIQTFSPMQVASTSLINISSDTAAWESAFNQTREPLISYTGKLAGLGEFFGDSLSRDSFIAFQAPEKRGKTFWLMELAVKAAEEGRRVIFFAVGDMSQSQMLYRFGIRFSKRPRKDKPVKWPSFLTVEEDEASVEHDVKELEPVTLEIVKKKLASVPDLILGCYPNSSINVAGIKSVLREKERESGWVPDVVVIDYADILAPPIGVAETRDQINATWKQLRALSQEFHCLVVTATQSDAASYDVRTIGRANFSEDKRKYAHVSGMVGINATATEQRQGVSRLNWLVLRESEFDESKCVYVAGCVALGRPAVLSSF